MFKSKYKCVKVRYNNENILELYTNYHTLYYISYLIELSV